MKLITLKEFIVAVLFSILFAWLFIYVMPSMMIRAYSGNTQEMRNKARAEAYHQYLIRKGYINE